MARLLIWCFVWIQVHSSKKSSSWKHFFSNGDQGKKVVVTSRCSNVATSPRRDVPTSRRPHVATLSQQCRSQQVKTSRVSSRSAPHHLKYEWLRNQGIGRHTNEGTEFQSRVTQTSKKCPRFVLFLIFWILE